jgi:hypothetical protein
MIPNVVFSFFGMVSLAAMPESPRFLVSSKQFDRARDAFNFIARFNGLPADTANNYSFVK